MNCFKEWLEIVANFSAIATAVVAIWFWYKLKFSLERRISTLEKFLKSVREKDMKTGHQGACSIVGISRYTGLNEPQIWECFQNSKNIEILARLEEDSVGEVVFFRYKLSN